MRRWILTVCILVSLAWTEAGAELTVATYNVQNYTLADRRVDGVFRRGYPKPEAEKSALRAVLRSLNADVLILQEMGTLSYLEELQRDLSAEGIRYPYAGVVNAADTDRHLAFLSRIAPEHVVEHTDLALTYFGKREPVKRGLLELRLRSGGQRLVLFGVHLKSRYTDRPDDPESKLRRAGEAVAIRDRIFQRVSDDEWYVILGDFNDVKSSRPIQAILRRGKTPLSFLTVAADTRGEAWTYRFARDDVYSRVDHILVSPALQALLGTRRAEILDLAEVDVASDHRPVKLRLPVFGGENAGSP
ncbi:MAG TPA: endonuclease/exonuclease/phosphatase family protein [Opitutaceae bacterium]|nr:endonuclease/exonuclease/phosphatase family protein [Opitutaceae bacterium]